MNENNQQYSGVVTRRSFLRTTAGGAAAMVAGWMLPTTTAFARRRRRPPVAAPVLDEATISQLQGFLASKAVKSQDLVTFYHQRIASLNPLLHAVIELNPDAMAIAQQLDQQRKAGHLRGPLHGIPILIKDNIATADRMQTTAGSLALVGSKAPADAVLVSRLRAAGAIILGKANLSEWANFRSSAAVGGWSARGGFTRNAYRLDFDPSGSSTGSAVGAAANLCAGAVGTETNGSIVFPSANNLVVGLKPTVGLISQDGIIPVARSQDTAGPIARTVTDAAILLAAMQSPFGSVLGHALPSSYTSVLQRGTLKGARIGVDRRYFSSNYGAQSDLVAVSQRGLDAMQRLGAILIDTDSGDPFDYADAQTTTMVVEFKTQIASYLSSLTNTSIRTLADLIQFNFSHCATELRYFGQENFQLSQASTGDLNDPQYLAARATCIQLARTQGIDAALQRNVLDAIVAPGYTFAAQPAAVAGYPNISIPVGLTDDGKPAALWMWSGFLQERKLLAYAYDLEQELQPRQGARLMQGSLPPLPAASGPC
jgi:amidase